MSPGHTPIAQPRRDEREALERGLAHHRAGRLREAEAVYQQIVAQFPSSADAHHLLASLALQARDLDLAEKRIEAALALRPQHASHHHLLALVRHAQGRIADATAALDRALALDPRHVEAHFSSGALLQGLGRLDEAAARYRDVLALDARHPVAYNNLGVVLQGLGRHDEAIASYRTAVALAPASADAQFNLGNALREAGELPASAAAYREALALRPDHAPALNNLAAVLQMQGDRAGAIEAYRGALRISPDFADARFNLGALIERDAPAEAAACFRRVTELFPAYPAAHARLGGALAAQGDWDGAVASCAQALALDASPVFEAALARVLVAAPRLSATPSLRESMVRALGVPWARPADLARIAAQLLHQDGQIGTALAQLNAADDASGTDAWRTLARDPLLMALLVATPVADIPLERGLTRARATLLQAVVRGAPLSAEAFALACALSHQCHLNEYVFACSDDEAADVAALRERIRVALDGAGDVPAAALVVLGAYESLDGLDRAEALESRTWPESVAQLLGRQVDEPQQERALRAALPRLTAIDDAVSRAVQQQYEENPYPRWSKLPRVPASTLAADLRERHPAAQSVSLPAEGAFDMLIAGAGTGQEPIETAQRYPAARILAVDLSAASLAYARRETDARGIANVRYAQADLRALPALRERFDVISSVGVLHHLADPAEGLRALRALLRPGGVMQIGLYSERGRRAVSAAREWLAATGHTADDVRRARQALLREEEGRRFARVTAYRDFHSTSECRDLLFHVQEHRFTLPAVARLLGELDLALLGFVLPAQTMARYRQRFAADRMENDLACWDAFEAEQPDTFARMYIFWVRDAAM